jgi:hypothetical protein
VAAQIATRKPHEKARQAGVRGLALDRFENFGDYHPLPAANLGKNFSDLIHFTLFPAAPRALRKNANLPKMGETAPNPGRLGLGLPRSWSNRLW